MDNTEVNYNNNKDKFEFKRNCKVEDPILSFKAEIE